MFAAVVRVPAPALLLLAAYASCLIIASVEAFVRPTSINNSNPSVLEAKDLRSPGRRSLRRPSSVLEAKDSRSPDADIDVQASDDLPLALPGAGGSSFNPLTSGNRLAPVAEGKDLQNSKIVNDKFELQYTCKICDHRNSNRVSRIAYRNGVVICVCKGCMAKHLIADNLGWHNYIGGFEGEADIEQYLASRGREGDVKRVSPEVFELEQLLDQSGDATESNKEGEEE